MNTGKIIAELRSQMDWSQSDLATISGISRVMIGKYERDEALHWGGHEDRGEGVNASFDKKTVERMQEIESLSPAIKKKFFFFIDTVLRDTKAQKAYAQ